MASELVDIIKNGEIEKFKEGLAEKKFQQFLHKNIFEGDFPIHLAAKTRNDKIVRAVLEAGCNVNQGCEAKGSHRGYTAAHEAAGNGDLDVLKVLKEFNADFNRCSDDQWYPLHCAVYKGKHGAIQYLLENGADVNCETQHHQTPLCFAVSHGRPRDVRLLLKNKARVDINDTNKDSLLHHALHYRMSKLFEGEYDVPESQLDVVVILVLNGVSPAEVNNEMEDAFVYMKEDLPSLEKGLTIMHNMAAVFSLIPIEWNYMSFVTAKEETLVAAGVPAKEAHELCTIMRQVDKEREESKQRKLDERPQGGCPVMRGKRKKTDAAAAAANGADPSGGKCPFFQKKDGGAAAGGEMPAMPAGHPPIPSNVAGATSADPSGGKCPFFQKKNQEGGVPATGNELPPVCPFSVAFVQRHATVLLMIGFSFVLGMWVDQLLNRMVGN